MDEIIWSLTLSDGTELKDLTRFGAYFVSSVKVTDSDFDGKTDTVTISYEWEGVTESERYANMEARDIHKDGGKWYFLLVGLTEADIKQRETDGQMNLLSDGLIEVAGMAATNEASIDDVVTALMELAEIIEGGSE